MIEPSASSQLVEVDVGLTSCSCGAVERRLICSRFTGNCGRSSKFARC